MIKMYRQKLEFAHSMIVLAAVLAFVEAGLHIIGCMLMLETSGLLIIIPCIDSGLIVVLALLMMEKKNSRAALILLIFYVIRIFLGMDLVPGSWKLFVITPWSVAVLIFQFWGLYYTYRYNKLLPAVAWEAENKLR